MITSIISARSIALLALSISIITGCGESPVDDVGANAYLDQATSAQAQPDSQNRLYIELEATRPTLDAVIADAPMLKALPQSDGNVADPGFEFIEMLHEERDADGEAEDEFEQEESIEDGFDDGDATSVEWKYIAKGTCRNENARLVAFRPEAELSESLYRGARFLCEGDADDSDEVFESKFLAVVLGGELSCKPYEAFLEAVQRLCGHHAEIVGKKFFNACSDSDAENMFESALFVCRLK
jgi:hypothetical protein